MWLGLNLVGLYLTGDLWASLLGYLYLCLGFGIFLLLPFWISYLYHFDSLKLLLNSQTSSIYHFNAILESLKALFTPLFSFYPLILFSNSLVFEVRNYFFHLICSFIDAFSCVFNLYQFSQICFSVLLAFSVIHFKISAFTFRKFGKEYEKIL